jgi:nucleoside-diphosphate-sugar epimerase
MRKVFVAGHSGMVGAAILRQLQQRKNRGEALDLTDQAAVPEFMQTQQPVVVLAAAKVGRIHANKTYPANFVYENLMIERNVIHQAFDAGVTRLL